MKEDTRGYRGLEGITDNLFSKEDIARYLCLVYFVYRGSSKLQAVTWDYKGWQGVKLQGLTGRYKDLQGVTRGYIVLQWVTRGYRVFERITENLFSN